MGALPPFSAGGETIYGKLRRRAQVARRANPHALDYATGLPKLLPAAQAPTIDTSQTWANAAAVVSAGYSQAYPAATAGVVSPKFAYTGGWTTVYASSYVRLPEVTIYPTGTGNAGSNPAISAYCGRAHFTTDSPKFVIGGTNGGLMRVIVDGQYVSLATTAFPAATPSFVVLDFTATGGRASRDIIIEFQGVFNFLGLWFGPKDTYEPAVFTDSIRAAYFGDSISTASNAAVYGDFFCGVASDILGIQDTRSPSIGTTGYGVGTASLYKAEEHVFDIINQSPDIVFLTHNVNSFTFGWAATQPYWQSVYGQIRNWRASVPIFQIGVLNSASSGETNYAAAYAYEVAQKAYVTALAASDPNLFYVPVMTDLSPWIVGTGNTASLKNDGNRDIFYDQGGPHPNTAGHQYVGMRFAKGVLAAIAGKA